MGKVKGGQSGRGVGPHPQPPCPSAPRGATRGCVHPLEISKKSDGGARAPPHPLQKNTEKRKNGAAGKKILRYSLDGAVSNPVPKGTAYSRGSTTVLSPIFPPPPP